MLLNWKDDEYRSHYSASDYFSGRFPTQVNQEPAGGLWRNETQIRSLFLKSQSLPQAVCMSETQYFSRSDGV